MTRDPGQQTAADMAHVFEDEEKARERDERNKVKISNTEVIENLGQSNLVICDKTGTLTTN